MKNFKNPLLAILALGILLITSCNGNQKREKNQDAANELSPTKSEQSYIYTNDKDTILLTLQHVENTISGTLNFLPYEKDSRRGTIINGQHKGDTLYAIYNSIQEGEKSECEIAFLKKNDDYILSHDIFRKDNYEYNADYSKGRFKNKRIIKFDGEILKKVN